VAGNRANLRLLLNGHTMKSLEAWVEAGQVSPRAAEEIRSAVVAEKETVIETAASAEEEFTSVVASPLIRQARSIWSGVTRVFEPPQRRQTIRRPHGRGDSDLDSALNTADHLTGRP